MSVITFMIMQVPTPIPNFDTYKANVFLMNSFTCLRGLTNTKCVNETRYLQGFACDTSDAHQKLKRRPDFYLL